MGRFLALLIVVSALALLDSHAARAFDTCVEVAHNVVPVSSRQKSIRSACDPAEAKRLARDQSAQNVLGVLGPTCHSSISHATAQQICAAHNMHFVGDTSATAGETFSLSSIPAAGQPALAFSLALPNDHTKCVALRDLPGESSTSSQADPICLFSGTRTIVLWRMRGHCGVICK
jgi:hypothetical protein